MLIMCILRTVVPDDAVVRSFFQVSTALRKEEGYSTCEQNFLYGVVTALFIRFHYFIIYFINPKSIFRISYSVL